MKKICVLLLLLSFVTGSVFASAIFQFGPAVQYAPHPWEEESFSSDNLKEIKNYNIGGDVRVNIQYFQLDVNAFYSREDGTNYFNSMVTANVNLGLTSFFSLGAGVGPLLMVKTDDWKEYRINYQSFDNFGEALKEALWTYRLHADVNLGGISVSAFYNIPTKASINDFQFKKLEPELKSGQVGVAVLFNLF